MNLRRDFELWILNIVATDMGTSIVGLIAFCSIILLQDYGGQGVECGSLNINGLHNQRE